MCYRLRRYFFLISFAALTCLPIVLAADEVIEPDNAEFVSATTKTVDSKISNATEHVVGVYYAYMADYAERRLLGSGLAKPEIDDVVNSVAQGFSECIISSLQKANNAETAFTIELLANGAAIDDVALFMDANSTPGSDDPFAVFNVESDACIKSLDASYGLSRIGRIYACY